MKTFLVQVHGLVEEGRIREDAAEDLLRAMGRIGEGDPLDLPAYRKLVPGLFTT